MNEILNYCIIAIPIVIGVVSGINKKIGTSNKYIKEAVTIYISFMSVVYYINFIQNIDIKLSVVMLVVIYFGASGIYQFIPSKNEVTDILDAPEGSE